jgi:hypothetical protein
MMPTCDLGTWEAEVGISQLLGKPGYTARNCPLTSLKKAKGSTQDFQHQHNRNFRKENNGEEIQSDKSCQISQCYRVGLYGSEKSTKGWRCSSVTKHLPSMIKALGSMCKNKTKSSLITQHTG